MKKILSNQNKRRVLTTIIALFCLLALSLTPLLTGIRSMKAYAEPQDETNNAKIANDVEEQREQEAQENNDDNNNNADVNTDSLTKIEGDTMLKNGPFAPMVIEAMGSTVDINSLDSYTTDSKQISIDKLFGTDDRSTTYTGEVPPKTTSGVDDAWSNDHPSIGERWVNGAFRTWAMGPSMISKALQWPKEGNTTDYIHAVNQTGTNSNFIDRIFTGMNIGYGIFAMLNSLWSKLVNVIIFISNFDVPYIMQTLNLGELERAMNELFIKNNAGNVSGVMIVAAMLFIVSLTVMIIKRVTKGEAPLQAIFREILMMCLAFLLAAFCLANGPTKLASALSNASSALINAITNPGHDDTAQLFQNDSGDGHEAADATNTLSALFSKVFIDMVIRNQFGVPVNELYLWDDSGSAEKNWGLDPSALKGICTRLTSKEWVHYDNAGDPPKVNSEQGDSVFAISNHKDGSLTNNSEPNLGYYWYAVVSDISTREPYREEDNKLKLNRGDRDYGPLYVVDFLSGVDAATTDDAGDPIGSTKARTIIEQWKHPVKDVGQMFACSLVSLCTMLALVIAAFYALVGKLIFNIGALFIAIVPILLLIPFGNLRKTTLDLVKGWGIAALKMVVGQVYIVVVITFSVALCASGILGMFLDCAFLLAMAFASKKLFSMLNATFGQHEPGFMRSIDRGFDRATGWMSGLANPARGKQALDKLRGKAFGKKKGKGQGDSGVKDPNQNALTNADPNESAAVRGIREGIQQKIGAVDKMSASDLVKRTINQDANGKKFLDLVKTKENLANAKGTGFMAKFGGKVRDAQAAILNNTKCQKMIANGVITGGALGLLTNSMGAIANVSEHASLKNAAKSVVNNVKLSTFEMTHNIGIDGKVEKAGVFDVLANAERKVLHQAKDDQWTVERAQEKAKANLMKYGEQRIAAQKADETRAAQEQARKEGIAATNRKRKQQERAKAQRERETAAAIKQSEEKTLGHQEGKRIGESKKNK